MTSPPSPPTAPDLLKRSLISPFNRAGAPRISDLGFDAGTHTADTHTLPVTDQDEGEDESAHNAETIPSIPGERIGHVSYGFEGERWRIRNIVWVVAQSRTGLALVEETYRAGYRIAFDTMATTGEKLTYFTNPQDRVVMLDIRATPEQQVAMLTLGLGVASAAIGGLSYDSSFTPPAAIAAFRMAMAYAHALQVQVAFDLKTADSLPDKIRRDSFWEVVARQTPRLAEGFERMAVNDMALAQGSAMAGAIRAFYTCRDLRLRYETEVINHFRSLPPLVVKDPKAMVSGFDPTNAAYKLSFPGMVYAMSHEPRLILTTPANMGAAAATVDAVAALAQARRTAGVKDRDSWQIPVAGE